MARTTKVRYTKRANIISNPAATESLKYFGTHIQSNSPGRYSLEDFARRLSLSTGRIVRINEKGSAEQIKARVAAVLRMISANDTVVAYNKELDIILIKLGKEKPRQISAAEQRTIRLLHKYIPPAKGRQKTVKYLADRIGMAAGKIILLFPGDKKEKIRKELESAIGTLPTGAQTRYLAELDEILNSY